MLPITGQHYLNNSLVVENCMADLKERFILNKNYRPFFSSFQFCDRFIMYTCIRDPFIRTALLFSNAHANARFCMRAMHKNVWQNPKLEKNDLYLTNQSH